MDLGSTAIDSLEVFGIFANKDGKQVLVEDSKFSWRYEDEYTGELTLSEISEQLKKMGYEAVFYVWRETALSGEIYQFGNYTPEQWDLHGTTKGYA